MKAGARKARKEAEVKLLNDVLDYREIYHLVRLTSPEQLIPLILRLERAIRKGLPKRVYDGVVGESRAAQTSGKPREQAAAVRDLESELSWWLARDKSFFKRTKLLAAWESGDADKLMLAKLVFPECRHLRDPDMLRAIIRAAKRNDLPFFKSLGRRLAAKPPSKRKLQPKPLETLLLKYWWLGKNEREPALRYFALVPLAEYCRIELGSKKDLLDAVGAARRRLGLKTYPKGSLKIRDYKLLDEGTKQEMRTIRPPAFIKDTLLFGSDLL